MKKYRIISIVIIAITILFINTNYTYADKEDLEKEYTKKGQAATNDFVKIFGKLNKDGDDKLSMEELEKATDEQINTLAKIHQVSAANNPKVQKQFTESSGAIAQTYNDRRASYGLEEDDDTTAGKRAEDSGRELKTYYSPDKQNISVSSTKGIDDMMGDADRFVSNAKDDVGQVGEAELQHFSSTFYNIFLTAGTAIAVISGMVIGIKYMMGSVDEKADIKTMLVPYVIGCLVVFGSFGIWKVVIEIMENM